MNWTVQWLAETESTNAQLKQFCAATPDLPAGTVVATRRQTAGRGRAGRRWLSAPDRDLCFSLLWRTQADPRRLVSLPMAAALAVDDFLRALGIASHPKWPNDVLVGTKKICGILAESAGIPDAMILGIGVNVNSSAAELAQIDRPATSVLAETGRTLELKIVLDDLLQRLAPRLAEWDTDGFPAFRAEWIEKAGLPEVWLQRADEPPQRGRLTGYGEFGQAIFDDDGLAREIWSGDLFIEAPAKVAG